jgi:hypothetical protein
MHKTKYLWKFVGAVLAVFVLVGIYLFGFDIEEAGQIISELQTLGAGEATIALTKRAERGVEADRGKLWSRGSTLKFFFLDGEERKKAIVRAAIDQWAEHVNLTISETTSPEAEIRISFKQPEGKLGNFQP